jgi:type VI secretion system protein ImpF
MAGKPSQRTLLPSLMDRLIDREPANRNEAPSTRSQSLKELKDSVRRDLEWLLNSRRPPVEPPPSAKELLRSAYFYGLPDITGMALTSAEDQIRLVRIVEATIDAFEPRLINVAVSMQPAAPGTKVIHFQIEALLRTEPAPARVFFDTVLELSNGQYEVAGETHAR